MGVLKFTYLSVLTLCAAMLACGGIGGSRTIGGGGGSQTGTPVYVTNNSSANVSVYQIDQTSGALQRTTGSPVSTGGSSPDSMVTDPAKKFLLVANSASASTSVFSVNSATAALTPVTSSPFSTPPNAVRMVMDPGGKFVYTLSSTPAQIQGFTFNSTTGALTALSGFPVSLSTTGETGLAISPNGTFLFTSNSSTNVITGFAIAANGALTRLSTTISPLQGSPFYLTFGTSGNFLFAINIGGNVGVGSVSVLSVSSLGALTEVSGSPFATGTTSVSAVFSQGFLYVVNQTSNTVSAFTVNNATGSLTALKGSPFSVGTRPISITTAALGRFLIVTSSASSNSGAISVFAVATDGTITPVTGSPFTPDTPSPDQVLAL